ncbi:MAG: S8 family serine peptidase, partial [Anaerolineales bacterium]
ARWVAVRACVGFSCTDEALLAGAQWLLAPTNLAGGDPRPDLRPNIINNSWGKAGETDWYTGWVTAWNAAGMFSVFANGNYGSIDNCQSSTSPGAYVNSFAVGATDDQDVIADFSSRGPTTDGRLKPDLSAPGVAVPSAWPDGAVKLLNGTSMATPHVAGVAALLWSANPDLIGDLAATEYILTSTAVPRPTAECGSGGPPASPNNVYGWGRVDARQAVQQARVDVPWLAMPASVVLPAAGSVQVPVTFDARQVSAPGTYDARLLIVQAGVLKTVAVTFHVQPAANTALLTGRFSDVWHGAGVYGRLQVGQGPAVQTDSSGYYTVTLPYGAHNLTATATGYLSAAADISITAPLTASFVLTPDLPHLQWSAGPISATLAFAQQVSVPINLHNAGTRPLSITATIPPLEWVVDSAGVPAPTLYDLSAMTPISLSDDSIYTLPLTLGFIVPIFGRPASELYLSSNGWLSVDKTSFAAPLAFCLPVDTLPPGSLAPFWADLDPSQGGRVRFGPAAPDTFVVSFEQVPPWRQTPDPSGPTYTFQLALHADGEIEFLYGEMGPLPAQWSVGTAYDHDRGLRLGCHKTPVELGGRAWSLHNQPAPGPWLSALPSSLTLAPGASAELFAVLSGFGYAPWHPGVSAGVLRLNTNDPAAPVIDLPAAATVGPAPYEVRLLPVYR